MTRNRTRRALALLLCSALCALALPVAPVGAETVPTPAPTVAPGFTGIYDEAGLRAISGNPGGKYQLMADIDLKNALW